MAFASPDQWPQPSNNLVDGGHELTTILSGNGKTLVLSNPSGYLRPQAEDNCAGDAFGRAACTLNHEEAEYSNTVVIPLGVDTRASKMRCSLDLEVPSENTSISRDSLFDHLVLSSNSSPDEKSAIDVTIDAPGEIARSATPSLITGKEHLQQTQTPLVHTSTSDPGSASRVSPTQAKKLNPPSRSLGKSSHSKPIGTCWPLPDEIGILWTERIMKDLSKLWNISANAKESLLPEKPTLNARLEAWGDDPKVCQYWLFVITDNESRAKKVLKACKLLRGIPDLKYRITSRNDSPKKLRFPKFFQSAEFDEDEMQCEPPAQPSAQTQLAMAHSSDVAPIQLFCGQQLFAFDGQTNEYLCKVTLGGFIAIDGVPFGVTVAHFESRFISTEKTHDSATPLDCPFTTPDETLSSSQPQHWFDSFQWDEWTPSDSESEPSDSDEDADMSTSASLYLSNFQEPERCPDEDRKCRNCTTHGNSGYCLNVPGSNSVNLNGSSSHIRNRYVVFRLESSGSASVVGCTFATSRSESTFEQHGESDWCLVLFVEGADIRTARSKQTNNLQAFSSDTMDTDTNLSDEANFKEESTSTNSRNDYAKSLDGSILPEVEFSNQRCRFLDQRRNVRYATLVPSENILLLGQFENIIKVTWSCELDRPIARGDSGTWVLDEDGRWVGQLTIGIEGIPIAYYSSAVRIVKDISSIFEKSTLSFPDSYIPQIWNQEIWEALWRVRDFDICRSHSSSLEILAHNAKTVERSACSSTKLHEEKLDVNHETPSQLASATKADMPANSIDSDSKNNYGQTLLSFAAERGQEAVVKLLLATEGIDPDSKDDSGQTPLSFAAEIGHEAFVKLLLATEGIELNSKDDFGQTPLLSASERGQEAVVKLLLASEGIDPDSKNNSGRTPLLLAAANGYEAVVKLLLATEGIDPDSKDDSGQTPLSFAAGNGHEAVVKLLLATKGIDPDPKNNSGRTPLSFAAEHGYKAVAKILLASEGIDLNSKDNSGRTPLSFAAEIGHEAIVKLLLATESIELDPKDKSSQTPLSYAAMRGHKAVVKLLLAIKGIEIIDFDLIDCSIQESHPIRFRPSNHRFYHRPDRANSSSHTSILLHTSTAPYFELVLPYESRS